jgi:type IV pilus assembly protein PilM
LVDLDLFAVLNAFGAGGAKDGQDASGAARRAPDEVVALANIGATFTNLSVSAGGRPVFWRDLAFGGNRYTQKIMEDLGVSREGAESLKRGVAAEDRQPQEAEPSLSAASDSFAGEMSRNAEFLRTNHGIEHMDRIVLTGGGSKTQGLAATLRDRFRVTVEAFDPLARIGMDAGADRGAASDVGCAAAVAIGLALRSGGGR